MYLYLQKHEASIRALLVTGGDQDWSAIKAYHRTQIDLSVLCHPHVSVGKRRSKVVCTL